MIGVAVSPAEIDPSAPTMRVPVCGFVLQPSALTHWSMPCITESRRSGFLLGVPLYLAIGSFTLWNSMVGTAHVGWMTGISTWPEMDEMAATWPDASAAMAYAIIPPFDMPVTYTRRRSTGGVAGRRPRSP